MTAKMLFGYFNLAKPYFKNRQEMFDLLEKPFDYIAENHKWLYMMRIEVLEATAKVASEAIKDYKKALQEYEKLKLVFKWLNVAEMHFDPRFKSMSCADYKGSHFYVHPLGYFPDYNSNSMGTKFDKFEEKILRIEQGYTDTESTSQSLLNDEFKMLELANKIDQALAELKAKMGL